ncbi:hypothetical protein [Spongiivirga citrea]|uniref:Uncharacterized protein n=1 Tax=Spongiivirga citrea TaxID=1481457 RepID=A0A6M0CSI7_9FLAO|nr:hypothetical protein [Spongiivirga citrea]NER19054.1 hypothetical protein [Spongiivirga citrea]
MKTSLFKTLFLVLMTLFCHSCNNRDGNDPLKDPDKTICLDYSDTEVDVLPNTLINDMVKLYSTNQLSAVNSKMVRVNQRTYPVGSKIIDPDLNTSQQEFEDAKAIWFDLETLKKFIYHIENETKKVDAKIVQSNKLGIRIYYASYPSFETWSTRPDGEALEKLRNYPKANEYGFKHTLLMIPTFEQGGVNYDFNPLDAETYDERGMQGNDSYNSDSGIVKPVLGIPLFMNVRSSEGEITARNHGGLYPPNEEGLAF